MADCSDDDDDDDNNDNEDDVSSYIYVLRTLHKPRGSRLILGIPGKKKEIEKSKSNGAPLFARLYR